MEKYFLKKYSIASSVRTLVMPIISQNSLVADPEKAKLNLPMDNIVFVYSGNFQKWQRIEDVLSFIKAHDAENHSYIFMTKEKDVITEKIKHMFSKDQDKRFTILTVMPEALCHYYSIAHYGFLLRDDHILNRVANPTKMLEYLFYGITPIVDLEEIGDYSNYDHIRYDDKVIKFSNTKSIVNRELAKKILSDFSDTKYVKDAVLGIAKE
jgi:hypothetical protein